MVPPVKLRGKDLIRTSHLWFPNQLFPTGVGTVEVGAGWNGGAVERRTVRIEGAGEAAKEGEKETTGAVVVGVEGAVGTGGVESTVGEVGEVRVESGERIVGGGAVKEVVRVGAGLERGGPVVEVGAVVEVVGAGAGGATVETAGELARRAGKDRAAIWALASERYSSKERVRDTTSSYRSTRES